ncbi:MAG TPA: hypothetical protein ENK43_05605 [Planctomycetes bacterium]|nr:hypothetical protein [Planctomycetota bacterium]
MKRLIWLVVAGSLWGQAPQSVDVSLKLEKGRLVRDGKPVTARQVAAATAPASWPTLSFRIDVDEAALYGDLRRLVGFVLGRGVDLKRIHVGMPGAPASGWTFRETSGVNPGLRMVAELGKVLGTGALEGLNMPKEDGRPLFVHVFVDGPTGKTVWRLGGGDEPLPGKSTDEVLAELGRRLQAAMAEPEKQKRGFSLEIGDAVPMKDVARTVAVLPVGETDPIPCTPFSRDTVFQSLFVARMMTQFPDWLARTVSEGLEALARSQRDAGDWKAGASSSGLDDVGTTALALLAFLGDDNGPDEGKYAKAVKRGLSWLMERQDAEGAFATRGDHPTMNGAMAVLALAEAYGATMDDRYEGPVTRGVRALLARRGPKGLWAPGSKSREASDLLTTTWCVMALRSASDAGVEVDESVFEKVMARLDAVTDKDGHIPAVFGKAPLAAPGGFMDPILGRHPESLTAMGVILRSRCGRIPTEDAVMGASCTRVASSPPAAAEAGVSPDLEYCFFGALATNDAGGNFWRNFADGVNAVAFRELGFRATGTNDPARVALLVLALDSCWRWSQSREADH